MTTKNSTIKITIHLGVVVCLAFILTACGGGGSGNGSGDNSQTVSGTVPWTQEQLLKFAPETFIHSNDPFLPSSVESYLKNAEVVETATGNVIIDTPTPRDIGSYLNQNSDDYYLRIKPQNTTGPNGSSNVYLGKPVMMNGTEERITAPMYVHVLPGPDTTGSGPDYFDLQYVFFYSYSGPQIFTIGLATTDSFGICGTSFKTGFWSPMATHQADFEHTTVRVNSDFTKVIAVYTDAHGRTMGKWWQASDPALQFVDGTHVRVYSALSTHASYPYASEQIVIQAAPAAQIATADLLTSGPITCGVLGAIHWMNYSDVTNAGPRWQTWDGSANLVELRFDDNAQPINGQDWLGFPGRYGDIWDSSVFNIGTPRLACNDFIGCSTLIDNASWALEASFRAGDFTAPAIDSIFRSDIDQKFKDGKHRAGPKFISAGWFFNGDPTIIKIDNEQHTVPDQWHASYLNWTGDLNGDGRDEIVSASGANVKVKWWDPATKNFISKEYTAQGTSAAVQGGAHYTWLADYDGDGRDDIITAIDSILYVKRYIGNGTDGNFVSSSYSLSTANWNTDNDGSYNLMGDLDGDGQDEIVSVYGSKIWVKQYNKTTNEFVEQEYSSSSTSYGDPGFNWMGDLDGDGKDEIISAVIDANNIVSLYIRKFTGSGFTLRDPFTVNLTWGGPSYNWVGDINGDGRDEIVSGVNGKQLVIKYVGDDNRSEAFPIPDLWGGPSYNWLADLDGDGKDELIAGVDGTSLYVKWATLYPSGTEAYPTTK